MKLHLVLPVLAAAALGVAWWLGRSERHGSAGEPAPVEATRAERDEPSPLTVPTSVPSVESVAADASADSTRTPSADAAPPPTLALHGTVRDERDVPVEGCQVVAFPRRPEERPSSERETRPIHRVPAPGGSFVFAALEPGLWFVHAERGELRTDYAFVALDGTAESAEPVELRLVSRVRLAGVVLDPDGRPFASGRAVANSVAGGGERLQNCDDDGRFEFPALAAGPIVVHARADDWAPSEEQRLELVPGAERTDLVLRLRRGASITGVVLDGNAALAGQAVVLGGVSAARATTDERGRFAFEGLAPGAYVVASADGSRASMQGNWLLGIVDGVDPVDSVTRAQARLALTLAEGEVREVELGGAAPAPSTPSVLVHGIVRLGGAPCPNAMVGVAPFAVGLREDVLTDAEGRFSLSIASPGSVNFSVRLPEGTMTYHRREIPPAEVVELLFDLAAGEIAGRVLDPEGEAAGMAPLGLRPVGVDGAHANVRADESGRFLLRGIQPGRYVLTAGDGAVAESWAPVERPLTIGTGEHLELELTLLAAARLRGTVRTADGRIFPGATVLAFAANRRVSDATCDSQGDYALGSLVPGRVRLLARTEESCSSWRDVELRAGELVTLDLELAPAVSLEIETVDERGEPVAAYVWIEDDAGHRLLPGEVGGQYGEVASHTSVSLPPGDYQVVAWRSHAPVEARRPLHLVGPGPERVRLVLAWTRPGR